MWASKVSPVLASFSFGTRAWARVDCLPVMSSSSSVSCLSRSPASFPLADLQPKRETGVHSFLAKKEEFDGRNVIIAVLDSGVDPGADGLQVCSNGERKVVDRIDCTGAGDVAMAVAELNEEHQSIKGSTGRILRLPSWSQGHAPYRVGQKSLYSLYPGNLKDRSRRNRYNVNFESEIRNAQAKAVDKKLKFEENDNENSNKKKKEEQKDDKKESKEEQIRESVEKKLTKDDLEAENDLIASYDKRFKDNSLDLGPIFDVVLYHDGTTWMCLIDVSEKGDLESALKLKPFRESGDFASIHPVDRLNVSINVFDEGEIVQIVSVSSSHGTHVACMAAANFPNEPEKNGVAPGAQIVSLTIGDNRIAGMETGTGLSRAMTHIMRAQHYKVDVINMSYGEHGHWSNSSRLGEMMADVVMNFGVVWIVSAGNAGPALSTLGAPPDILKNCQIGVGAYVSPEMMSALYSTRAKLPSNAYTWTSRGPAIDGDRGVTVCAPGGAITSVPNHTHQYSVLMNGTSMAAPHTAGSVALLLSGMKQEGLKYSPFTVKRALANSAKPLDHVCFYGQGNGLLQVPEAFESLKLNSSGIDRDIHFHVTCDGRENKGVYLRNESDTNAVKEVAVRVEPIFLDANRRDPQEKIALHLKLVLGCTASWVRHPDHFNLNYSARPFVITVDPTGLPPGVHSAYIKAFDSDNLSKGSLFEVPIHVVKSTPLTLSAATNLPEFNAPEMVFGPGQIRRHFITVPDNATWAVVKISGKAEEAESCRFYLHTVQLLKNLNVNTMETKKAVSLNNDQEWKTSLAVKPSSVLELCLGRWWANFNDVKLSYSITFHGLIVDIGKELVMHCGEGVKRVELKPSLGHEEVGVEAKIKNLVQFFKPSESKITTLGERDRMPPNNKPIFELTLSYNFNVPKATDVILNLTWLSEVLYESQFESQLWLLYNSHQQVVGYGDAFADRYSLKVEKGDHVLKAHVRHDSKELLEKLNNDLPLSVSYKLASPFNLDVYSSYAQAMIQSGKKMSSATVKRNNESTLYVVPPILNDSGNNNVVEKALKGFNNGQGQYLSGTISFGKDDLAKKVDFSTLKLFPIEKESSNKRGNNSHNKNNTNGNQKGLEESLVEQKINYLAKLDVSKEGKELFDELKNNKQGNQVQLHMARLNALEIDKKILSDVDNAGNDIDQDKLSEALALANFVLDNIDESELLSFFAMKSDARPDASEIKKEMDKKKSHYIEASCKKGYVLSLQNDVNAATSVVASLMKFVDVSVTNNASSSELCKISGFLGLHAERLHMYARALKLAQIQLESQKSADKCKELVRRIQSLLTKLGLNQLAQLEESNALHKFKESFEPF